MAFCTKCGAQLSEDAVNCPVCGAATGVEYQEPVEIQQETIQPEEVPAPKKKKFTKKRVIGIIAIVLAVALLTSVGIGAYCMLTNNYKTPLDLMVKLSNLKELDDPLEQILAMFNGFTEEELKDIISIAKKSDGFDDMLDSLLESFDQMVEQNEDKYGDNYKFSYVIEEKTQMERKELREIKDGLKEAAKTIKKIIDQTDDFDSDDWTEMADQMGVSRSDAKKLIELLKDIYREWRSAEITEGYALDVIFISEGSKLDEPEEEEETVHVVKINGRWISAEFLQMFVMSFNW